MEKNGHSVVSLRGTDICLCVYPVFLFAQLAQPRELETNC